MFLNRPNKHTVNLQFRTNTNAIIYSVFQRAQQTHCNFTRFLDGEEGKMSKTLWKTILVRSGEKHFHLTCIFCDQQNWKKDPPAKRDLKREMEREGERKNKRKAKGKEREGKGKEKGKGKGKRKAKGKVHPLLAQIWSINGRFYNINYTKSKGEGKRKGSRKGNGKGKGRKNGPTRITAFLPDIKWSQAAVFNKFTPLPDQQMFQIDRFRHFSGKGIRKRESLRENMGIQIWGGG